MNKPNLKYKVGIQLKGIGENNHKRVWVIAHNSEKGFDFYTVFYSDTKDMGYIERDLLEHFYEKVDTKE